MQHRETSGGVSHRGIPYNIVQYKALGASTGLHRHTLSPLTFTNVQSAAYPWVQLMWQGSQLCCLLGYLKMNPSPPISPMGHVDTQCGPSLYRAHATHSSAP